MKENECLLKGRVAKGHGVASGMSERERFPEGTLALQIPEFLKRGLDLRGFFPATINVDCAPLCFRLQKPDQTFRAVHWDPAGPAEDFSFVSCEVLFEGERFSGLVYYPHPETKPAHFQSPSTLELLSEKIPALAVGKEISVSLRADAFLVWEEMKIGEED